MIKRAAHAENAGRCIDRRSDHREIKPRGSADIAIQNVTDVQREAVAGDGQTLCRPLRGQCTDPPLKNARGLKRAVDRMGIFFRIKDGQKPVPHELQHIAAMLFNYGNDLSEIGIQKGNHVPARHVFGQPRESLQIEIPDHRMDRFR